MNRIFAAVCQLLLDMHSKLNSMEQIHFWEASSPAVRQETLRSLYNWKFNDIFTKMSPLSIYIYIYIYIYSSCSKPNKSRPHALVLLPYSKGNVIPLQTPCGPEGG
jgi:hypothetical protein